MLTECDFKEFNMCIAAHSPLTMPSRWTLFILFLFSFLYIYLVDCPSDFDIDFVKPQTHA